MADAAISDRAGSPAVPGVRWLRTREGEPRRVVQLLDVDHELAQCVPAAERELARNRLVVAVQRIPRGAWTPNCGAGQRPLAYLLLAGTLLRGCRVGGRWSTEILGPGDLLRPWEEIGGIAVECDWQALECAQTAILDRRLAIVAARWPEIVDELLARSIRRSRNLAILRSICAIRRLDIRLLVLLRVLAERWGRVSPRGVHLGVRLTHETLARLVGAQRPSVSTALARLRRDGLVATAGRELILAPELPPEVADAIDDAA
jgi:CRP/FNR family transcriptional regulator, cyclic AMP receptor protein